MEIMVARIANPGKVCECGHKAHMLAQSSNDQYSKNEWTPMCSTCAVAAIDEGRYFMAERLVHSQCSLCKRGGIMSLDLENDKDLGDVCDACRRSAMEVIKAAMHRYQKRLIEALLAGCSVPRGDDSLVPTGEARS